MLNADDLLHWRRTTTQLISDNEVKIIVRRGNQSLPEQAVRLLKRRGGHTVSSRDGSEIRAPVLIVGNYDLDVKAGDVFTLEGVLYKIRFVQPDRRAGTVAEAELAL